MSDLAMAVPHPPLLGVRKKICGTAFREKGQGEAVLLIHGVGLNADAWEPQIEALASTHRVIVMDMLGHGESDPLPENASLSNLVTQVGRLLAALGISAANVIGHSMGGLVAIGFALAHPEKCLRLGVLNSVYKRSAEKRAAIADRARQVTVNGNLGNVDETIARWFAETSSPLARRVRSWLLANDAICYGKAYSIFAAADDAYAGQLCKLTMPSLFATGSLDPNSSPEMAEAMAREAMRGRCTVLQGERHMMNLTAAVEVNARLQELLKEPLRAVDPRELRSAFGTFMTGVTVVTTREENGTLRGFTANSFSSVSLDPPLLLICIAKAAGSCEAFSNARRFAVNILAESQKEISGLFASKRPDKFQGVTWRAAASGAPLIEGAAAWFDCVRHQIVDAGDHVILIGRVIDYAHTSTNALGYARGGYFALGLEQSAVDAASGASRAEVGAILECDGELLVRHEGQSLALPRIGEHGKAGSASQLVANLAASGVEAHLDFLFAVFENPATRTQSIYYRGEARLTAERDWALLEFDKIPWADFHDEAVVSMLRRYCDERVQGRYRIYSGDHERGEIRELS